MSYYSSCFDPYSLNTDPDYACSSCSETEQRFDDAKDYLTGVIEEIYGTAKIDLGKLEHCLDELCRLLGMAIPPTDLNIERKSAFTFTLQQFINSNKV